MGLKIAVHVPEPYCKDQLFNERSDLNRDDCNRPYIMLKQRIEEEEGSIHTCDLFEKDGIEPSIILYQNVPPIRILNKHEKNWPNARKWLIVQECEVIMPRNWDNEMHKKFNRIFTWNDSYIDGVKYIKLNFTQTIPNISFTYNKRENFCAMIAGNKKSNHPLELYSKRIEVIRWYESNASEMFDLYGVGWDRFRFEGPKVIRALNRIHWVTKMLSENFPSYKGPVSKKKDVLERYSFSICFENAKDIPGYITEKIFDCFFAGCIPIYWGANNVTDHIPANCFIDMRKFSTYDELHSFLLNMNENDVRYYRENIENFVTSKKMYPYSAKCFVDTLFKEFNCET